MQAGQTPLDFAKRQERVDFIKVLTAAEVMAKKCVWL